MVGILAEIGYMLQECALLIWCYAHPSILIWFDQMILLSANIPITYIWNKQNTLVSAFVRRQIYLLTSIFCSLNLHWRIISALKVFHLHFCHHVITEQWKYSWPHSAACEKIGAPVSPKTEKKSWGQSLYAIMDNGSPKTIRVCHIFRFSKNP